MDIKTETTAQNNLGIMLYNILSEMDLNIAALKDIQNLSILLDEDLDEEMQGSGDTFISRFVLYRSLLNVAFSRLRNVTSELENFIENAYKISYELQ